MEIGEDDSPQGVDGGGRVATGVNGGDGREERPVPPMMATRTGSAVHLFQQELRGSDDHDGNRPS